MAKTYNSVILTYSANGKPVVLGNPSGGVAPTIGEDLYGFDTVAEAAAFAPTILAPGGTVTNETTTTTVAATGTVTGQATTGV